MENSKKIMSYKSYNNIVKIDEDELECLRKLGEHTTSRPGKPQNQHTVVNKYKMVRINEDEVKNLLKVEANNTIIVDRATNNFTRSSNGKVENKKTEDINESAEKFIQSFKKQLLLQRLESIENADKILARGL
ncbi:hypothetical protein RND81_14G178700 [Saponaria officinalis]|uniref:Uncharacterized protein n=1 Tax=Saponaria officinalis TaxID=3572 RepID=A0AAW1GN78_SAPOF